MKSRKGPGKVPGFGCLRRLKSCTASQLAIVIANCLLPLTIAVADCHCLLSSTVGAKQAPPCTMQGRCDGGARSWRRTGCNLGEGTSMYMHVACTCMLMQIHYVNQCTCVHIYMHMQYTPLPSSLPPSVPSSNPPLYTSPPSLQASMRPCCSLAPTGPFPIAFPPRPERLWFTYSSSS